MTLADVAAELYALPPGDFTAARNARAKQLRADGDRELAGRVQALRKPTLAAWAVDLLVRRRPDQVEELLALGPRLLEAQAARAGDALRELNRQHHVAMAALRDEARRLAADAGQRLGDAVDVPLESTLRAAMTDPDAAAAVRTGLLVSELVSTGFGPVEVGDAVAVPDAPPLTSPGRADGDVGGGARQPTREPADDDAVGIALPHRRAAARTGAAGDGAGEAAGRLDDERAQARRAQQERDRAAREAAARREREQAERDLAAARRRAATADGELADAVAAVEQATGRRAALDAEVARLEEALTHARDERDAAARAERHAVTAREAAERAASTAARRARAAEQRLDATR